MKEIYLPASIVDYIEGTMKPEMRIRKTVSDTPWVSEEHQEEKGLVFSPNGEHPVYLLIPEK